MDFHAAVETFAEAWVVANIHPATVTSERQASNEMELEDIQTQLPREPFLVTKTSPTKHLPPPLSSPSPSSSSSLELSPSSCTRSLPIHCIIEQTNGSPSFDNLSGEKSTHSTVELDSYAILPGTTLLTECVRAALLKLGYNSTEAIGAKGAVQVKNWRPLDFETITDNKNATIDDMLGELTQVATLRIRICRQAVLETLIPEPYDWTDDFVRWTVLDLLKVMNQSTLAKLCPLPQSMISNIVNSKYPSSLSSDKLVAFGTWYKEYRTSHKYSRHGEREDSGSIRVTFHPNMEVPKLKAWYKKHPNPSDDLLTAYANDLNSTLVRLERPKIKVKHLKNWWVNQRQKLKRNKSQNREESQKSVEKRREKGKQPLNTAGRVETSTDSETCERQSKTRGIKDLSGENQVRKIDGQGVVHEVNVSQNETGNKSEEVRSKVRKTVLGNHARNFPRNSPSNSCSNNLVLSNQGIRHHHLINSASSQSDPQNPSGNREPGPQYPSNMVPGVERGMISQHYSEDPLYHHLC